MSRQTKLNFITKPELIAKFHRQNAYLITSFLEYLQSTDKAKTTIEQYKYDLNFFFCWNVTDNDNKPFTEISKKDLTKFQGKALSEWEWSPNRLRRVKSTLSSLSSFIEDILDEEEEFKGFRPIINKIKNPIKVLVRDKTVFEPEELQSILDTLVEKKQYEIACALSLAMNSARRKAEITRFKVSYFTPECVLENIFYKTPEKVITKGKGSKGKQIYLYILKEPFDPYLKLWLDDRKAKGIDSIWLFPKTANPAEHITVDSMDYWAAQLTAITGKNFYWHSIRHYATTQFLKAGVPDNIVQEFVGWDSPEMVNHYNDATSDDMLVGFFKKVGVVHMRC